MSRTPLAVLLPPTRRPTTPEDSVFRIQPYSLEEASYLPMTSSVRLLLVVLIHVEMVRLLVSSSAAFEFTVTTLLEPLKLSAWLTRPAIEVAFEITPLRPLPEPSIAVAPWMAAVSKVQKEEPVPLEPVGLATVALTVIVALADLLLSAWLVARTVTLVWLETLGAVKRPFEEMLPLDADQVTAVLDEPETEAVNCCVPLEFTLALDGDTETATVCEGGGAGLLVAPLVGRTTKAPNSADVWAG